MKHRKFIALIVALSVAVTGFASAPARAGDQEVRDLLTGLAVLGVIGAVVAHEQKKKKKRRRANEVSQYGDDHHYPRSDRRHGHGHGHGYHNGQGTRPLPHRVQRKLLPAQCRRTAYSHYHGQVRGFGKRCLQNNFAYYHELPRDCVIRTHDNGKRRAIFQGRCLRGYGYQVAERR